MNIPWYLSCEPREVQLEALRRSYGQQGFCFFMEMRLGKSSTVLNEFLMLYERGVVDRMLVFAPNKFKAGWKAEASKFNMIGAAPCPMREHDWWVLESKDVNTNAFQFWLRTSDRKTDRPCIISTNYEATRSDKALEALDMFVSKGSTMLVLDESAMIKNNKSIAFKKTLEISKKCPVVRCLSGLPAPNAPYDLWTQLRTAKQLNGFNFYAFKYTFTKFGGWKNKQAKGVQNEDKLNEILDKCAFRALRKDWNMEKDLDYEQVEVDMTPKQTKAYRDMQDEFVVWLNDQDVVSVDTVLSKHMKLQQISSGFIYNEHGAAQPLIPIYMVPKYIDLIDRIDNYIPGKVLIIAHYKHTMNELEYALRGHLMEKELDLAVISSNKGFETEFEKFKFNANEYCKVMLAQSSAVKYGHTLMGTTDNPCLSVCFYENTYSLDTREQCEQRPQGAGQGGTIHIWDYYSSPIEKKIVTALQGKKKVSEVIMGEYERG